jgi:YcxB-like protein
METVNLSFRYAEKDYVRAMRAHYASRLRLPLDVAVTVGVAVLGAYEWRSGAHAFGVALLCVSGIFALILVAAFAVIPRISFRSQPKFRDEYSLRFSPEGIHFQTVHIDSDLQWGMYTSALVDAYSFILYYGTQQFTVIPKRVFQDASQRQTFERLLLQNVSKVVDKTK